MDSSPNTRKIKRKAERPSVSSGKTNSLQSTQNLQISPNYNYRYNFGSNSTEDEHMGDEISLSGRYFDKSSSHNLLNQRLSIENFSMSSLNNSSVSSSKESYLPIIVNNRMSKLNKSQRLSLFQKPTINTAPITQKEIKPNNYQCRADGEQFKDKIISKCFELCNISENKLTPLIQSKTIIGDKTQAEALIKICMRDQESSKSVQKYLEKVDISELMSAYRVYETNMNRLILDRHGSYIVPVLIKRVKELRDVCEVNCILNVSLYVSDKCAVKVMQALAEISSKFCYEYVLFFSKEYYGLIRNPDAVLVLNKCIPLLPNEYMLHFIVEDIVANMAVPRMAHPELLRLLPNLLDKLTGPPLNRLVRSLIPKIGWLMDEKIGNFCVHTLFKPKFVNYTPEVIRILTQDPILLFQKKCRRFILTKILAIDGNESFFVELIKSLCMVCKLMDIVFDDELATFMLLGVLTKIPNLDMIQKLRNKLSDTLERICNFRLCKYYREFLSNFDQLLSIRWKDYNERILYSINSDANKMH